MDAIKYLIQEHNKFRRNLAKIASLSNEAAKKRLFAKLALDLSNHEKMEQTVWYPFVKRHAKLATPIKNLVAEEKKAAKEIGKIKKIRSQETWDDKFSQLKKDVSHHAKEEETKLFPKAAKAIDKEDLDMIGKKMRAFKATLNKSAKGKTSKKKFKAKTKK